MLLQSDYRLRGYSLSEGQPAAGISIGYDDPSGIFAAASAIGVIRRGDPGVLAVQTSLGYAARIAPGIAIEGGVTRAQYFSGYGSDRNLHYTEVHLGLSARNLTTRIHFSPDYFASDTPTLYAELDGGLELAPGWLLNAHLGLLGYLDEQPTGLSRRRYDWRLGGTRQIGPYGIHLELTGRIADGPAASYSPYGPYPRHGYPTAEGDGTAVVVSLTRAL